MVLNTVVFKKRTKLAPSCQWAIDPWPAPCSVAGHFYSFIVPLIQGDCRTGASSWLIARPLASFLYISTWETIHFSDTVNSPVSSQSEDQVILSSLLQEPAALFPPNHSEALYSSVSLAHRFSAKFLSFFFLNQSSLLKAWLSANWTFRLEGLFSVLPSFILNIVFTFC